MYKLPTVNKLQQSDFSKVIKYMFLCCNEKLFTVNVNIFFSFLI
jgi:hypothetical protein